MADTFNPVQLKALRYSLLRWYDRSHRKLPWRADRNPYRVWVSEIMLQQTRVAAVIDYYERFLRRFSDVHALARARESSVLAAWSGLGYYRRARFLHAAARIISRDRNGQFPTTSTDWAELPGVGAYTAAAIASIAFSEHSAVVDGNVERVLRRLTGYGELAGKALWNLAQELLSPERPGDFNQAVMELGATVCLPGQPACEGCPIASCCHTRGAGLRHSLPARKRKELSYLLAKDRSSVYLVQRREGSLMPGMWELPSAPSVDDGDVPDLRLRHSITDTDYTVTVMKVDDASMAEGRWIPLSRVAKLPLTGLTRKILRKADLI